ncbi:hypothetical protein ACS0TY_017779 [Phlomoides rotata]
MCPPPKAHTTGEAVTSLQAPAGVLFLFLSSDIQRLGASVRHHEHSCRRVLGSWSSRTAHPAILLPHAVSHRRCSSLQRQCPSQKIESPSRASNAIPSQKIESPLFAYCKEFVTEPVSELPGHGFEMLAIWSEITAESSLDMAELENASSIEADKWFLSPCLSQNFDISDGSIIGFASQLNLLVKALEMSSEAKFIEDFVSGSETLKSSAIVPPPTVLDPVLKDLFHEDPYFT